MTDYLDQKIDINDPRIASIWDELSFWSSRFGILFFENLEFARGIEALDLGCGNGFPLFELAHTHGKSCRFTGVDLWDLAIERAALKKRVYGLENVNLIRADGSHLPFLDSQFDLITSNLGINNFNNPAAVFSECARVARPQARLALTTNIKGHMERFYDLFRETLADLGMRERLERLAANEDHRGTKESICEMIVKSGFSVSKVVEDQFYLRYLDGSAMLRHFLTRIGFLPGWRGVLEPGEEEGVFALLEDRLNRLAADEGELRMTIPMLYIEARKI